MVCAIARRLQLVHQLHVPFEIGDDSLAIQQ
jgi:hypothetical protein